MIIYHDSDEWKTESKSTTCSFHKRNPGAPWAGCTCSFSIGQVRRDPAEVAEIKARKRRDHEEAVLAEADRIRASRAIKFPAPPTENTGGEK